MIFFISIYNYYKIKGNMPINKDKRENKTSLMVINMINANIRKFRDFMDATSPVAAGSLKFFKTVYQVQQQQSITIIN